MDLYAGLCIPQKLGKDPGIKSSSANAYAADGPVGPALPTVEVYDPATDTWTNKADIPTSRHSFSTSVVDGKIYAIDGAWGPDTNVTVEEFDPEAGSPQNVQPTGELPTAWSAVEAQ